MQLTKLASIRTVGFCVVGLWISLPLLFADRQQPSSDRNDHSDRGDRGEGARGTIEHGPAVVERVDHGSLRHVDTRVVERPIAVHHDLDVHQRVVPRHDVDVDVHRPRFWHGFAFGERHHVLRGGCVRIFVGNVPYFYDDGIYFQQVGDDYQEVYPPVGAAISGLPDGAIEIDAGNIAYYYAGGAFYVQQNGGFVIAPPPMGVIVPELPPGAVQVSVRNSIAYQFNGIYYQPVFVSGATQYATFMP